MLVEIENQNDVCILRLKGRFVMATDMEYLRLRGEEIKIRSYNKLLVDLSDVCSIGSTVIGFVVDLYTFTIKNGNGRFMLAGANSRVLEVLDLTRLSTLIPLAADTESGLAVLCGASTVAPTASR